jgi:hypothetical protein
MQPNAGQIANDEPDAPSSSGDVGTYLLWVLIVAGGVLLVFYILNEIPLLVKRARAGNRQGPRSVSRSETEEMVGPASEGLLEETDRLASQGDYGDAVHVLLLRILEDLRSHLGPELRPSLTSREIVKHVTLPDDGASALGRIVNVAERSHFGGRAPSELEYRACRENFQHLVVDSG